MNIPDIASSTVVPEPGGLPVATTHTIVPIDFYLSLGDSAERGRLLALAVENALRGDKIGKSKRKHLKVAFDSYRGKE